MTTILSIDPGGLGTGETGIAYGVINDATPYTLIETWAVPDNLDGFREWYIAHQELLLSTPTVICEQWVDRNIAGADRSPMLIEGAVRFLRPDVVLQPASGKNTGFPDTNMFNLGFSKADFKGDHHGDRWEALRHALWWLKKQKHIPTLLKAFPHDV